MTHSTIGPMICHHHECLFIHIPKNAGQSIEHVFLDLLDLTWETRAPLLLRANDRPELGPPRLAHLKASEYVRHRYITQEMFDRYFKFAFVRNPWARVTSFYKYLGYRNRYSFKQFAVEILPNELWRKQYWFVGPQYEFIQSDEGTVLVDFLGRFESLQHDFDEVARRLGLGPSPIPHVNRSSRATPRPRPSFNPRKMAKYVLALRRRLRGTEIHPRYQDYYDSESKEAVAELYRRDIELFAYAFEPPAVPAGLESADHWRMTDARASRSRSSRSE